MRGVTVVGRVTTLPKLELHRVFDMSISSGAEVDIKEELEEEQGEEVEREGHEEEDRQLKTPTTSAHAWMTWMTHEARLEPKCDVNTVHQRAVRGVLRTAHFWRPCALWCSCH